MSDGWLRKLRDLYRPDFERPASPPSERPGADVKLTRPAKPKPTPPLQRPADISPEEWAQILERPVCTLTAAELARNDKVLTAALEKAAREVQALPQSEWSPYPWRQGPTQDELRAREVARPFTSRTFKD
jgi:hypothetical protein